MKFLMCFLSYWGGMAIFSCEGMIRKSKTQRVISLILLQLVCKVCGKDGPFILSTSPGELQLGPPSVMLNVQEFSLFSFKKTYFLLKAVCISLFHCRLRSFLLWPLIIELRCSPWNASLFVQCGLLSINSWDQGGSGWFVSKSVVPHVAPCGSKD